MTDERVFSDDELRLAGLRSVDALAEALEAGDRDAARHFAKRLRREALSMRSNYDHWEAALIDWVRRRDGEATASEAHAAIAAAGGKLPAGDHGDSTSDGPEAVDFGARWRECAHAIDAALMAGRADEARTHARRLNDEALRYHDRGMARVNALLSWIGRRYDTDALEKAYIEAMAADLLGNAGFRERAEALMHFTRFHLQPFALEEDADKLTFLCAVCPSGGRLLREGHYDGPDAALRVRGPRWLTWNRNDLPVYCAHEPVMERASIQQTGEPLFIVEPSEALGETPCKTYLYKDPAKIPERFYTRLGLEKPRRG